MRANLTFAPFRAVCGRRSIPSFCIERERMMKEKDRKKIEEMMAGMKCPKGFKCSASGFEQLCKANDFGLEGYLDCLEKNPRTCPFAISFGHGHLCHCRGSPKVT
jgi:hypothetical protein